MTLSPDTSGAALSQEETPLRGGSEGMVAKVMVTGPKLFPFLILKVGKREFPGGPVVRTL